MDRDKLDQLFDNACRKYNNITVSDVCIIQLAYQTMELLQACEGKKLFFEQANCFLSNFVRVRNWLKLIDEEYLNWHESVRDFFSENYITNDWDIIKIIQKETEDGKKETKRS